MKAEKPAYVEQQNRPQIHLLPHTLNELFKGTIQRICIPILGEEDRNLSEAENPIARDAQIDEAEVTLHDPRRIMEIRGRSTRSETRIAVHVHYKHYSWRVDLQWNHPNELRQAAKLLSAYLSERLYGDPQHNLTRFIRVLDCEIITGGVALKPPCEPIRFLTGGAEDRYRAARGLTPSLDPIMSKTYPLLSKANLGYRQSNNYFKQMIAELCEG